MSFGFVKNGGMNAEALIFFDPAKAEIVPRLRKRAGHLLSKGRYLAAQILAMLEGDLWLTNANAANDTPKVKPIDRVRKASTDCRCSKE